MKKSEKKLARELEKKARELEKKLLEKKLLEQAQDSAQNLDSVVPKSENELFEQYDEEKFVDVKIDRKSADEMSKSADWQSRDELSRTANWQSKKETSKTADWQSESGSYDYTDDAITPEDMLDYCDFIQATSKKINTHTARVAGGWGEKRGARMLRELSQDALFAPSRLEPFDSRMLRGRGSFVVLGIWYAICLVLYLLSFTASGVGGVVMTVIVFFVFTLGVVIILSLLLGFSWFIKLYPKKISYNVVSELASKTKTKRTLIVSCNYDSQLGNNFKLKANIMPKILLGAVCSTVLFLVFCIIKMSVQPNTVAQIVVLIVPPFLICVAAIVALVSYVSLSKNKVKDNNAIGVATALASLKYLQDNNLIPDDCKVMFVALAAENAGHEGAEEFVALHGQEGNLVNPIAVNFGDVNDDKITVVTKDAIHAQVYDESLAEKVTDVIKQKGIAVESYDGIFNSIYGFSSTPFAKAGIPAITILSKDMTVNILNDERVEKVGRDIIENGFKTAVAVLEKIMQEETDEIQGKKDEEQGETDERKGE